MESNFLQNYENLSNLKLPFIAKIKKFNNFERQINSLNDDLILLEKYSLNSHKNLEETKNEKEKNNNNKIRKKNRTINFLKKSKSTNKLKLNILKNPKYKSSKHIIKNIFTFQSKKNISPILKSNIHNFKLEDKSSDGYFDENLTNKHKNEFKTEGKILNKLKKNIKSIKFNDYLLQNDNNIYQDKTSGKILINPYKKNIFNFKSKEDKFKSKSIDLENSKMLLNSKLNINLFKKDSINNNNLENIINENEQDNSSNINNLSLINKKDKLNSALSQRYKKNTIPLIIKYVKELRSNNLKINRDLKSCKLKFEEINFRFGTKLKYSKWKYAISDYEKYFIDVEHFGEREKKEIERKKTFYDNLEDAVDFINETQNEKKYLLPNLKRQKIYEQPVKNNNKIKDNNLPDSDITKLNLQKIKNDLEIVNIRIAKEKVKRSHVKDILEKSFRDANEALKI